MPPTTPVPHGAQCDTESKSCMCSDFGSSRAAHTSLEKGRGPCQCCPVLGQTMSAMPSTLNNLNVNSEASNFHSKEGKEKYGTSSTPEQGKGWAVGTQITPSSQLRLSRTTHLGLDEKNATRDAEEHNQTTSGSCSFHLSGAGCAKHRDCTEGHTRVEQGLREE